MLAKTNLSLLLTYLNGISLLLVFPLFVTRSYYIYLLTYLLTRQTEKARHLLAVREKLRELRRTSSRDLSKPDKDQNNEMKRRFSKDDDDDVDCDDFRMTSDSTSSVTLSSDRQQQLVVKCVKLLTQKHFLEVANNAQVRSTIYLCHFHD